jgi:hypothetical protein
MLLPSLLLALQTTGASPADTAQYSSPAVRSIIERAAESNRRVPGGLGGYRVSVETEIALTLRLRGGAEAEGSIEQVASEVHWDRSGAVEQRVTGYRAQQVGPTISALSYIDDAWVVPSLYGNRLSILFGTTVQTSSSARADSTRRPVIAVHPLAADRERTYRYTGGDTIQTIRVEDREIRIVRINVYPRAHLERPTTVFEGEMDLDADRYHVVRLRGSFSTVSGRREQRGIEFAPSGPQGVIYVELVNSEVEQRWWLPATQRFEAQASAALAGETRAIFRILTRFGPYDIARSPEIAENSDTLRAQPHRLTFAPLDSVAQYTEWLRPIGEASSRVAAADFDDVAPDHFSSAGRPQLLLQPERLHDIVHVNRVEGLFTGLGATLRLRDVAPGVLLRGVAGYAWSEETMRWRAMAEWRRGRTMTSVRVGRQLDLTNKFMNGLDSASAVVGLFADDVFDYVDRRSVSAHLEHLVKSPYGSALRVDAGIVEDRNVTTNYSGFPVGDDARENRGVTEGRYARTGATIEWRPRVNGEFLRTGIGARLRYERGDGDQIRYQRVDGLVGLRHNRGPFAFAARLDAGAVLSPAPPPQQLFELGAAQGLRGFGVNAFAGDRAMLIRSLAMLHLPIARAPIRIGRRLWIPAVAPALAVSMHTGWTDASSSAAQTAIEARGERCTGAAPVVCEFVAQPSDGWRSSLVVGLRFFGGVVSLGAAKPLDGRDWRGVFQVGGQL